MEMYHILLNSIVATDGYSQCANEALVIQKNCIWYASVRICQADRKDGNRWPYSGHTIQDFCYGWIFVRITSMYFWIGFL